MPWTSTDEGIMQRPMFLVMLLPKGLLKCAVRLARGPCIDRSNASAPHAFGQRRINSAVFAAMLCWEKASVAPENLSVRGPQAETHITPC